VPDGALGGWPRCTQESLETHELRLGLTADNYCWRRDLGHGEAVGGVLGRLPIDRTATGDQRLPPAALMVFVSGSFADIRGPGLGRLPNLAGGPAGRVTRETLDRLPACITMH
jgi:hypothetical protein